MIKRRSTSALLQKAQSQLKGEKVSKTTEEEDDLNDYIKSLTKKTSHQHKKMVNFEDGEISISSDIDTHTQTSSSHAKKRPLITSGNKFLKKKQTEMTSLPSAKYVKKPQVSNASPVPTVSGEMARNKPKESLRTSSALSKASALSNKFAKRSAEMRKPMFTLETDSSESVQTPRPGSALGSYNERPRSADSDSVKIGKDGSKFMKKKAQAPESQRKRSPSPQPEQRKRSPSPQLGASGKQSSAKKSSNKKAALTRLSADVVLSSGEESLAEFVAGLDSSESFHGGKGRQKGPRTPSPTIQRSPSPDSKPPTVRRSPSPGPFRSPSPGPFKSHSPGPPRSPSPVPHRRGGRSPKLHRSHSSKSSSAESDILESEKYDESSDDAFRFNLMDIDALEPVLVTSNSKTKEKSKTKTKETSKAKSKKKSESVFKSQKPALKRQKSEEEDVFFGLQTVEDLLGGASVDRSPSVASEEVKTETEDIAEELGPQKRKTTSFHSVLESEIKTQDVSSFHRTYSDEFDDTISERIIDSHRLSRVSSRITEVDDYTETFQSESEVTVETDTETEESEKTERRKPVKPAWEEKRRRMRTTEVGLQTEEPGLTYRFNYSPGFIDPASIASFVISPDALQGMTSYNPCMLALHDMLKQQLELTKSFLFSQQALYRSMSESIDRKYRYTTLEDTKKYIKKNRSKKLSLKEALRIIDLENQS